MASSLLLRFPGAVQTHSSETLDQRNQGVCENAGSTASVRGCSGPQSILPPCMRCWSPCAETDEQISRSLTRISQAPTSPQLGEKYLNLQQTNTLLHWTESNEE